jgi:hypothetical protein
MLIVEKATDQYWRSIIDYSLVPTTEHLYIVGSFAKSVTVYSQQVRAIGLVDALAGLGRLRHSSRVAVIGGGIAGMTAAAALWKIGVRPVIYEKESTLGELQRNSAKRFLHPHIYDWPLTSIKDTDAELPVLNWHARMASEVVKDIEAQWKEISAGAAEIRPEVTSLERVGRSWRVRAAKGEHDFDVVLSCVGFGVESGKHTDPYWADQPFDDPKIHARTWLISGAGDGSLTDLMRLSIRNFLHSDALRVVVDTVEQKSGPAAIEALRQRVRERITGRNLFDGINADSIAKALDLRADSVTLNASEAELFGTAEVPARSSVLNRLILWVLIGAGKVNVVEGLLPSEGISGDRGAWKVRIQGAVDPILCEELLLRHGPAAPFGKYDKPQSPSWLESRLDRPVKRLAERWKALYKSTEPDPTICRDHWTGTMFEANRLSPDFRKHVGLLVYSRTAVGEEEDAFANAINAALLSERVKSAVGRASADATEVSSLQIEDALADPRALGRAIRALCDAPIVVFDGTFELPSLLFLVGVRSVVRRGVTVVVRVGELDASAWQTVAFNLRELRLVTVANRNDLNTEERVRTAVEEGLKLYARRPFRYADLPAFDAIRYLGGQKEDYVPRSPDAEVLVLCSFHDEYAKTCWPQVQRAVRNAWGKGGDKDPSPARRVIDLQSPELVGNRLYGSIRRDVECVADLTLDRPNVFFELGARLVANERGARVIRCVDLAVGAEAPTLLRADSERLDELVGTRSYNVRAKSPKAPVADALQLADKTWPGGTVTAGFAFAIAQDSVEPGQEAGGRGLDSLLWNAKEETVGPDVKQSGGANPALYAGSNPAIRAQTRRFAFDAMLAYILLTDTFPPVRRDAQKRSFALDEAEELFKDLELGDEERGRLLNLLTKLKDPQHD